MASNLVNITINGDEVVADFDTGIIENKTKGETYKAKPFPAFVKNIIDCGGLVPYTQTKIGE